MEIWKDIPGYEGLYELSSFGRVRSLVARGRFPKGYILVDSFDSTPYRRVYLTREKTTRCHSLRRLAKLVFPKTETEERESRDKRIRKINGSTGSHTKLTERDVIEILILHANYHSQTNLAQMYNVSISNINKIVLRQTWKHITQEMIDEVIDRM